MADASDGNTMKSLTVAQAANHFQPNIQYGSVLVSSAAQIIEFTDDAVTTALSPNHARVTVDITAKAVSWLTGSQLTPNINHRFITYSPADANTIRYSTIDDLRTYMVDVWARPSTPTIQIPADKIPPIDYNDLLNRPTIPTDTNDYATSGTLNLAGQQLSLTLRGTGGFADFTTNTVDLPAGMGGGGTTVVPNPGGAGLPNLTSIGIGGTNFAIPAGGGGAAFVINTLPNLASGQIADHDVLAIEDNSQAWAQRSITFGELAARLADGTTITSAAGTLSAVGGGGGMSAAAEILLTSTALTYTPNASDVNGESFRRALVPADDDRTMAVSLSWRNSNDSADQRASFLIRLGRFPGIAG